MFLDASVIVANLLEESEAPAIRASLFETDELMTSPLAVFEASLRLAAVRRVTIDGAHRIVATWLEGAHVRLVAIDEHVGVSAHLCAARYHHSTGHPARLNLGDCFAYAAARAAGLKLAYKGNDFVHTDIDGLRFGPDEASA